MGALSTGCGPTRSAAPQASVAETAPVAPGDEAPVVAATAPVTDEVRPPHADDLAVYTAKLAGAGALRATIETSMGSIRCRLLSDEAPLAVANFVGLATGQKAWRRGGSGEIVRERPFYDGLIFHRVIPGFMIQGGDQNGNGSGDGGYKFANERHPSAKHDAAGILSMANAGPDTNGTQFFITDDANPRLDGGYTVFGRCQDADVISRIARVPTSRGDKPQDDVVIYSVKIDRMAF
ncbi:MAG: peptidylprolyl isomerase [Myxococcales bacterium]|nr:peptidylprolyl isomerase [Myxococcales bacterium]